MRWQKNFLRTVKAEMPDTIKDVVSSYLCTQCGTCVAVCPVHAIEMRETPSGLLVPHIFDDKCIECGKCREVCPGVSINLDIPEHVDPFKGQVLGAYVAHACDKTVRTKGQSGGVVSALLLFLLETNQINAALVTTMPNDGSLRPEPFLARTREQVLAAQGSKYCPVATNAVFANVFPNDRVAVVGVSCQMHGLQRLTQVQHTVKQNIDYRIGLVCDRTLLYSCIDQMAINADLNLGNITKMEYRSKARNGWPGEVCFHLNSGEKKFFPSSLRMRLKDYFTPPRCRLCFDKMNGYSDITVGDAWGVSESSLGDSNIIARTEKGNTLLRNAVNAGYLSLHETDEEIIFKGQGIEARRQNFVAFTDACQKLKRAVPEYNGFNPHFLSSVDPTFSSTCKSKFLLNCKVAACVTRKNTLVLVRRHQFFVRIRLIPIRFLKRVWRKFKYFLHIF